MSGVGGYRASSKTGVESLHIEANGTHVTASLSVIRGPYIGIPQPDVRDLPADMRDALLKWLGADQ